MKKFLLFLILLIPIFNINALSLCDGTELLDLPVDLSTNGYVLIKAGTRYRAYIFLTEYNSITATLISSNTLKILTSNQNAPVSYFQLNTSGTNWSSISSSNVGYSSISFDSIVATTIDIKDSDNNIVINANYNIVCSSPEPDVPQDFSLINTIAGYINTFVTGLQNNSISIEVTFISLIIFNFLVFVICYIITHLE